MTPELTVAEGGSGRIPRTPELRVAKVDQKVLWRSQGATGGSKAVVDLKQSITNRYNTNLDVILHISYYVSK